MDALGLRGCIGRVTICLMGRKRTGQVEIVEWGGHRWRRWPDSKRRADRVYFKRNGKYLHRAIWAAEYGPIPVGHHIHHADGNASNNAIDNMECVTPKQHAAEHWTAERAAAAVAVLVRVNHLAKAWHRSPEGREWHREHARAVAENRVAVGHVCVVCAKQFRSVGDATICSGKCFASQRRDSGVDDVELRCPECGRVFRRNKYAKPGCCSRSCAARKANRERHGLQPDRC